MELNELTYKVIGLAIEVHKELGPGLLESAYQECLFYELKNAGLKVEKEYFYWIEFLFVIHREFKKNVGLKIKISSV